MPYFDAVKRWNLGGTSWCLPRKGTPGYETVMAIRRGEPAKTREEAVAEAVKEKKAPRKKRIKVSKTISLERQQPEMESVKVPTVEEYGATKVIGKKKVRISKKKEEPAAEAPKKELEKLDVTPARGRFYTFKTEQDAYDKIGHTTLAPALKSYFANVVEGNFDEYGKLHHAMGVVNISKSKKGDVVKAEFRTSNMKHGDGNYIVEPEFEIVKEVPAQPKEETKTDKEKKERKQVKKVMEEEKKVDVAKTYGKLEPTPLTRYVPRRLLGYVEPGQNPEDLLPRSPEGYHYYFTVGDDGPKIDKNIMELTVAPAIDAYNTYILELNKERGTPIRNAAFRVEMEKGKKVARIYHLIAEDYRLRTNRDRHHYSRKYIIEPTFEPLA